MGEIDRLTKSREKRRRHNRNLLLILLFLILLQMVFCVILFVRVGHLEKKMGKLLEAVAVSDSGLQSVNDFEAQPEKDYPADGAESEAEEESGAEKESEAETKSEAGAETESETESESALQSEALKNKKAALVVKGPDELLYDDTVRKTVYLTFDDGPSANTDRLLDILDEYGVKATFFTTGQEKPELIHDYVRIVEEGHTIGMHSYSHDYKEIYGSIEAFDEDFGRIFGYIKEITGVEPEFYRFPGGSSNLVSGIPMENFVEYLDEKGIRYFDWNVSAKDAEGKLLTVDELLDNIFEDIEKKDVCVVLLHDSDELTTTVDMLPELIERLKEMNALILPITENTKLIQHTAESVTQ